MPSAHVQPQIMADIETKDINRREFLNYIWGASMALLLAESCGAVTWLALPREHFTYDGDSDFIRVNLHDIPAVGAKPIAVANGKFYLANTKQGLLALIPICTHLGCGLKWVPTNNRFECPCHLAKFGIDGTMLPIGSARRDLDRFIIEVITDHGTLTTSPNGSPVPIEGAKSVVIELRHTITGQPRI